MRGKSYGDQNGKNPRKSDETPTGSTRRRAPHTDNQADWGAADGALLLAAVTAITRVGGAIRFGYTRDMGAYAVGFYEGGELSNEYIPPSEDINTFLKGVIEDYGK